MKSFHLLSRDQVEKLPFLDGGVMVLDEGVAACLRDFFASEKAKTVTIGGLHPDPALHTPNFAQDFLYYTTDPECAELQVTAAMPSTVVDGVRRDLLQVLLHNEAWLMEMVSCPLNPRCSLAHLQQKPLPSSSQPIRTHPIPTDHPLVSPERMLSYDDSVFGGSGHAACKAAVVRLEGRVHDVEKERDAAAVQISELVNEVERVRGDAETAANAHEKVGNMQRVVSEMVSQTKDAEVSAERSKNECLAARNERDIALSRLQAMQQEKEATGEKGLAATQQLKRENARLKQELAEAGDTRAAAAKHKKEVEHLRAKLADAVAHNESRSVEMDGKLERIQRDRDRLSNEVSLLKDKVREKDKERTRVGRRLGETDKLRERVAELEKELLAAKAQHDKDKRGRVHARADVKRTSSRGAGKAKEKEVKVDGGGGGGVATAVVHGAVNAEVVSPVFPDATNERIGNELGHLTIRFENRDKELLRCLQLLYGSDDEFHTLIEREEEEKKAAQDELRGLQGELREVTERFVQSSLALEKLKDKEQGMAQKFLEADKEYTAELDMMRHEVLSARADATLSGTELTTLRHSLQAGAAAAISQERTAAAAALYMNSTLHPNVRHVVSPPVRQTT